MNIACKHFKNPSVYDQEMEAVEKIFKEPVQMLIKQDVTSNIMGMDITLNTADLGETVEALGGMTSL